MRSFVKIACVLMLVAALPALAQMPTGQLGGRVMDESGPLPGVTITVSSPAQQGARTAVSSANGDYIFTFLPPGEYTVTFELAGFQKVEATVKISAAQNQRLDAELPLARLEEEIVVTGSYETISTNSQISTTVTKEVVDKLPIGRTPADAVLLAPGVSNSGPGGNVTVAGSQSYENLWLVNGVVVNENVRQQSLPLFIEDAIQETTATVGGVSAEYGRFAGGVITTLTKSGGNLFSGSYRLNWSNPSWQALRPGEADNTDVDNKTHEVTLGGFALKDRLWFFFAARDTGESVGSFQTRYTNIPYDRVQTNKRYEGKLTFSITPEHRLVGSYIKIDSKTDGDRFTTSIMDLRSLTNREDPQELMALNYAGVLSDTLFVEAQYSDREYDIGIGSGSMFTDRIYGTLLLDRSRSSARYWSPTFCGVCKTKERDNKDYLAKATWFLSSQDLGSHDIVVGYDSFTDKILEENHQSGSDYRIYTTGAYLQPAAFPDQVVPIISNSGSRRAYFYYQPQLTPSIGSKMKTDSIFVNDRWRFNDRWSFNVGLRYDKNDGKDSAGVTVADDSRLSPRLGASWDVKGNGELIVNASFARYVTGIQNGGNVGDGGSEAGLTSVYLWYSGPNINSDPNNLVSTEEALAQFFAWLDSVGGPFAWAANTANWRFSPSYPGLTPVILDSLKSPYADEIVIGASKRIGTRGIVRADYTHREFGSFYAEKIDGTVTDPNGTVIDRSTIVNDDSKLERKYDGVTFSGQYRFGDRLWTGGSYTWSQSIGNFIGETSANGPITSSELLYPEYFDSSWSYPKGYLPIDERHKLRLWGSWDLLATTHHRVNLGLVQYFTSGAPYSAVGEIDTDAYVTNPGYVSPDTTHDYFFSGRGAYRLDDIYRTDLSVTYSFLAPIFGTDVEIYVKPEVTNLFNRQGVINVNTQVDTAFDDPDLEEFDPFTEEPVEGVHWRKGEDFGQPTAPTDYQAPRTVRVAVGFRF